MNPTHLKARDRGGAHADRGADAVVARVTAANDNHVLALGVDGEVRRGLAFVQQSLCGP